MSSIRLFILSSFDDLGPMHGHRLRQEAERNQVHLWTEISVGAVYGAIHRLAAERLLRSAEVERAGKRPPRQTFEITDEGRLALRAMRRLGLSEVWFKPDPFDLALARMDAEGREALPAVLADRLAGMKDRLEESRRTNERARETVGLAKGWALRHTEYRLQAEVAYLTDLLAAAPDIAADERDPKGPV